MEKAIVQRGALSEARLLASLKRERATSLSEAVPMCPRGGSKEEKVAAIDSIVDALDVEHSARYLSTPERTYCNVYACDVMKALGVYLPRVFWTGRTLFELARAPDDVSARYDDAVHELDANALHGWLGQWGPEFGWHRSFRLDEVQRHVNDGAAAVVCASTIDPNRFGHISCVVPETRGHSAERVAGHVFAPLQSQAGANNRARFAEAWWADRRAQYSEIGFWWHD